MTSWYRRTTSERDTHSGHLRRGRVLAVCGVEFSPIRAWRSRGAALPGAPDPAQTCPECQRLSGFITPSPGRTG
jgi:hypothetical protein